MLRTSSLRQRRLFCFSVAQQLEMPMNDHSLTALYHLQNRLLTLKLLPRTGWLQRGVHNPESIAEHTFGVAMLALLVGDTLPGIDRGRLLTIALLHDMAEALVGDLPATARRLFGAETKYAAERGAMEELLADLPQAAEYLALWDEYVCGGSVEARLVKALDRLEMLSQALAYERAGSRALHEFWHDAEDWSDEFPAVRALADQLIAERKQLLGGDR
jgi:putative hydrolase of HD superfamily